MENSKIEWTEHTFNPWLGCTKISAACDFCYAESWALRYGFGDLWQGNRRRTSARTWNQVLKWNKAAPLTPGWPKRPRVFCASLADVFDNQVPKEWRTDLWMHPNKDFPYLARATAREMFAALWDTLHGSGQWLGNPEVVAISFEVGKFNLDARRQQ